jgi:hypothetical protein
MIVVPAKAGTHFSEAREVEGWIPAFAGMTNKGSGPEHLASAAFSHRLTASLVK